ncbi:hypothetical protein ILUMI_21481 [Ignelater luminosus]|uniref:Uncharacterized protein n=1 Tax=Ignelater luminosus TaxID=2038154 RepID=A0A8K0G3N3_IGNLU|nr:hypothetical protein ILUMI_21481 [Ignelater luminosus]
MYLIYWVIYGYLLILTRSQRALDVAVISQYLRNVDKFNMTCIISGGDLDSAIVWNEPLSIGYRKVGIYGVSDYIPPRNSPYNCQINQRDDCSNYWVNRGTWTLQTSVLNNLQAVADQRWEGMVQ